MPQFYSDAVDDPLTYERCESFGGGFDAFTRDTLLPADAFKYSENIVIPDNLEVRTRPGADRIATNLAAKIQGLAYFDITGTEQLMAGAGGKVYYTDSALAAWTDTSALGSGFTLASADLAFSAAQGIDKLLLTDGTQVVRWSGTAWETFPDIVGNPPRGCTVVLWHAGRMWASGFAGGTVGKENDAIWASALLTYGAGDWNGTDRSFRVGAGDGDPILGLCSIPASVPEQAILGVLKENSIHLVRTDPTVSPANYQDSVNPESVSSGLGVVGKRAFAVLGNDLFFVAPDRSFRSLARMEAAAAQYTVSPPLSVPLQPFIDRINWSVANLITVTRYNQLALFSVPLDASLVPNTVLVYSARLQRWVGVWTGWTANSFAITRFNGIQRLMHGDNVGNVRQFKDFRDQTDDATYLDDGVAIPTKLWSRAFLFGEPLNNKDAYHFEARFSQSNAVVNFTAVADDSVWANWSAALTAQGPTLPVTLPFNLTASTNIPTRKGLRGRASFNEIYMRVESGSGWWSIRNLSFSAFVNTLANQ